MTAYREKSKKTHIHTRAQAALVLMSFLLTENLGAGSTSWLIKGEPSFTMTVDGRHHTNREVASAENNIAVRGVVFPMSNGVNACFDLDLLRWSHSWASIKDDAPGLEMTAMAPLSYENKGRKTPGGQKGLTKSKGKLITALGIYPGFNQSEKFIEDPRQKTNDINEPGVGPIPSEMGRWEKLSRAGKRVSISYKAYGANVVESPIPIGKGWGRFIQIDRTQTPLFLSVTQLSKKIQVEKLPFEFESNISDVQWIINGQNILQIFIPSGAKEVEILIKHNHNKGKKSGSDDLDKAKAFLENLSKKEPEINRDTLYQSNEIDIKNPKDLHVTEIQIPETNKYVRDIRPSGFTFVDFDTIILCTFDGDIWRITGCHTREELTWEKIGDGLHEPQSILFYDGKLFSFTRNGLIEMVIDKTQNKIIDYKNFNNQFAQSTETREFAMDAVVDKNGNFYLAKGGQRGGTSGFLNGTILKASSRNKPPVIFARGLRQAYLGYNIDADWVTATDQQGNWIPSTPFHIIKEGGFYGFRTELDRVHEMSPTQEPILWMPHRYIQSGAGQIYIPKNSMNPLAGLTLCLDYYSSKLAVIYLNDQTQPTQAAFCELQVGIRGPILKGAVHPSDGSIWLAGFKIWGSRSETWGSLNRISFNTFPNSIPINARSHRDGFLLSFSHSVESISLTEISIKKWNYKRTSEYGSGYFRNSGEAGVDKIIPKRILLSGDKKSIFVETSPIHKSDQVQLNYKLTTANKEKVERSVVFTIHSPDYFPLDSFDFSTFSKDKGLGKPSHSNSTVVRKETGRSLYEKMGCQACHSVDGTTVGRSGPTLKALVNANRILKNGTVIAADEDYLKESIVNPSAKVLREYSSSDIGMPSYKGVLNNTQIQALVDFIKSLN